MTKFLVSSTAEAGSSPQIKKILSGGKVRIASAFLGKGAENLVLKGSRVICDIGMGGTNPDVLTALSKKIGNDLKYLPNFHAKVYISDRGCVVGSANLSSRGIGFLTQATLLEASVFLDPDDEGARVAAEWYEGIWKDAEVVGRSEIEWAARRWNANKRGAPPKFQGRATTFLDAIAEGSAKAEKWKFLLTKKQISTAIDKAASARFTEVVEIAEWQPKGDLDIYEDLADTAKRGDYYIGVHRGRGGRLSQLALRFIGSLEIANPQNPDDTKLVSYFEKLPWEDTGFPALTDSEKRRDGEFSAIIAGAKDKWMGRALTAKKLYKILSQGAS